MLKGIILIDALTDLLVIAADSFICFSFIISIIYYLLNHLYLPIF